VGEIKFFDPRGAPLSIREDRAKKGKFRPGWGIPELGERGTHTFNDGGERCKKRGSDRPKGQGSEMHRNRREGIFYNKGDTGERSREGMKGGTERGTTSQLTERPYYISKS